MTHAAVLIALPDGTPADRASVECEIAKQMAPFDENGECFADGSRWDWYQIGGRWTGKLDGYKPSEDPKNWEHCDICNGTGTRHDEIARKQGFKLGECNGCGGIDRDPKRYGPKETQPPVGQRVTFGFADHDGDIQRLGAVRSELEGKAFYAFLRDHNWHERDRCGWFGRKAYTEHGPQPDAVGPPDVLRFRKDDGHEAVITTHGEEGGHWEVRYYDRFLSDLPDDTLLVLVDYHV